MTLNITQKNRLLRCGSIYASESFVDDQVIYFIRLEKNLSQLVNVNISKPMSFFPNKKKVTCALYYVFRRDAASALSNSYHSNRKQLFGYEANR